MICEKCNSIMGIGFILSGSYDVYDRSGIMQYNPPASTGKLDECYKCEKCGFSKMRNYTNSYGIHIMMSDCTSYEEDQFICDDVGQPKGQCAYCGYKWYEHTLDALPECERESAKSIQEG